jgi:hypothetical protein
MAPDRRGRSREEYAMTVTAPDVPDWNPKALVEITEDDSGRPVLFTNARVLTMDPLIGTLTGADVLLVGSVIVGVGPGIITAAQDDNAIVVDCTGMTVVPAVVDGVALAGGRGNRSEYVATLTPGNAADLLVVPDALAEDVPNAVTALFTRPAQVRALVAAGKPVLWAGTDVPGRATAPATGIPAAQDLTGSPRVGVWIDREGFLHQELTADVRTPTRAGTGSTATASTTSTTSVSGPSASSAAMSCITPGTS